MPHNERSHMTPDEFRKLGHALIDWVADYQGKVESLPVLSKVEPGQIRAMLPGAAPDHGEDFEEIMRDLDKIILPGVTHWQSPNFFGFFPANNSGPSILGELVSAGLGVQGMMWATSPACTELETHVLDWVADMLGLPAQFKSGGAGGGVIQDSASSAGLCALVAARERATALHTNAQGCDRSLVAYTSPQAHSFVEKGVRIAGIGSDNLRFIRTDSVGRMNPADLAERIRADRTAGLAPFFVSATVGTTASNAIDPIDEIGQICRREQIWLHVDGAMSGTAAICPEFRHIHKGLELADSYAFNPHKWMFTNFDCDCFYVRQREHLIKALSILPEYLRNKATESGAVIDYRDWQVPLGRRFRALKLWFVIRYYGVQGLRRFVREHVALAQEFASWVEKSGDFRLSAPVPLNLVCFAHRAGDDFNRRLLERINRSGDILLSHGTLDGRFFLRFCVGQTHTTRAHVERAWRIIQDAAREQAGGNPSVG